MSSKYYQKVCISVIIASSLPVHCQMLILAVAGSAAQLLMPESRFHQNTYVLVLENMLCNSTLININQYEL